MKPVNSMNIILYTSIFLATQITGLLLSLLICFILNDFTWGFVRVALINSFILGLALIGSCHLSQRLIFKMRTIFIALISLAMLKGVSILSFLFVLYLEPALFIYYDRGAFSFLFVNFLFILTIYIISSGLIIHREIMVEKEKAIGNERFLKNQMELKLLSSRINPHFLFNTLNMILSLLKQPEKAELAILNLSDLLRENLEHSDLVTISVAHELENVRKYLEIQKLRFNEKLQYEIIGEMDFPVPPLTIQPLVENSIKHNMQNVSELSIIIKLSTDNKYNYISIIDSVKTLDESMLNKGQGLTITKKRVESYKGTFLFKNGGVEISFGL
jgi:sensor histidine kinase YesM